MAAQGRGVVRVAVVCVAAVRVAAVCVALTLCAAGPLTASLEGVYGRYGRRKGDKWLAVGDDSYREGRYEG